MRYVLQKLANSIVKNLYNAIEADDTQAFDYFMTLGINLDYLAMMVFNVELN